MHTYFTLGLRLITYDLKIESTKHIAQKCTTKLQNCIILENTIDTFLYKRWLPIYFLADIENENYSLNCRVQNTMYPGN
jgi:hypothetical protein